MDRKKFLTYEQQIDLLKNKGLNIPDSEKAITLLKEHSYFDLINGYKKPFKAEDGNYKKNISFDDIYCLYCFDDELRYALIKRIMEVEIHIKSLLSYSFCEQFGDEEAGYLNVNNYNYSITSNQSEINKLISIITDLQNKSDSFLYMKHQKSKYGNIPLWVLVKVMTLGNASKMYSFQKPEIQTKISKEFKGITEHGLETFLDILTKFRNVCAHNERVFDHRYIKHEIVDTDVHLNLNIPKNKNRYTKGK